MVITIDNLLDADAAVRVIWEIQAEVVTGLRQSVAGRTAPQRFDRLVVINSYQRQTA
jgi:hypothetical protein